MKRVAGALALCCCLLGSAAYAQNREAPLTNAAVVKLVKAGFKEKTIVLMIAARQPNFDLSPERMIELKRSGVSENIIIAMLSRQDGIEADLDDDSWGDDPFVNRSPNANTNSGSKPNSDGSTEIFGSSSGSKSRTRSRGTNGGASGESTLTGSATVRILRPPTEAGGTDASKLEKTKSLTNDSIIELVEAGFSEGTIIRRIEQSPVEFDLAAAKLAELKKRRVSERILMAMKAAMGEGPAK
ncbi:MAG TPA: hypothetical protein VLA93_09870 [Pyrinomonadaceae bacterium]|nr:hypothetical protein [Pyrinomonadaceae bacterium]